MLFLEFLKISEIYLQLNHSIKFLIKSQKNIIDAIGG